MSLTKKVKRLIIKLAIIIVLVLVIVIAGAILFIDHIAKTAVVKGVPMVLGNDITASVDRLHIEPFNGRVEIDDLIIGNPEGYSKDGHAFKLGEVIADVNLGTVTKDKIHIEHLRLKDIDVCYERGLASSNLDEILRRLEKKEEEEKEQPKEEKKESKEKTFQVDKLEIENVGVTIKIKGLPAKAPIHVSMDPLENLGTDEEGITATDLAYEILGKIIKKAVALDAVSDALSAAGESVTNAISGAADAAKDAGNSIAAGVNDTTKSISDAATETGKNISQGVSDAGKNISQGVGNAIGGLLGGGKKAEEETPAQPQGN